MIHELEDAAKNQFQGLADASLASVDDVRLMKKLEFVFLAFF